MPMTFTGMLSVDGGPPRPATFVGEVVPAQPPSPGVPTHPIYNPPGIWGGGNEPFPTPPIVILPPGIIDGKPEHPIYLPIQPMPPIYIPDPPQLPSGAEDWVWRYVPPWGWVLDPPGTDKPRPIPTP